MKNALSRFAFIILPLLVAGCVTSDTYEAASYNASAGAKSAITLGFSGDLFKTTTAVVSDGYIYGGSGYYRDAPSYGYTQVYTRAVTERNPNAALVIDYLERKGFIVRNTQPRYTVDVSVTRTNIQSMGDFWLVYLASLTFCDRAAFCYNLRVGVYDNTTGARIFDRSYEHPGSRVVLRLIPLFTASSLSNETVNVPAAEVEASWFCAAMDDVAAFLHDIK